MITIIGFVVVYQFVDPAPPNQITIACGPQESANFLFAKAYQKIMAKEGVTLNIKTTAGSAENLKLLQAKAEGVEVAFVQGGLSSSVKKVNIESLGSLFLSRCGFFTAQTWS